MDSVKEGINDRLSGIVQTAAPGSVEYVGAPKEDGLGGEGRLVGFEQPAGLDSLVNVIKEGLVLLSGTCPTNGYASAVTHLCRHLKVQLGRSPRARSDGVTSVTICAGSGGSILLGVDADAYFTGDVSCQLPCSEARRH